jgi:2-polyprenyl-3-methyl-5-hydroxy-6-metoxy-1,4-benzoquinol methylase
MKKWKLKLDSVIDMPSNQQHWDGAYADSESERLGWYQSEHEVTLSLFQMCDSDKKRVIDVGAGVTTLIDSLTNLEYNIGVLDISSEALRILKTRHGDNISYIHGDLVNNLNLEEFDIWHDRAVLHFLLEPEHQKSYVENLHSCISPGGYAIIETFSTDGAQMCCGLDLQTYDEIMLRELLGDEWVMLHSLRHIHINPFGGERPYISTIFQRKSVGDSK